MKEKMDTEQDEFSRAWTGKIGTKRQTYYIYVDLIAKLRGYAYWERRGISEVVNCALDQFFKDKEVKPRPPRATLKCQRKIRSKTSKVKTSVVA